MPNAVGTQLARSLDWILCKSAAVTFNTIQYFHKRNPTRPLLLNGLISPYSSPGKRPSLPWDSRARQIRSVPAASKKLAKPSSLETKGNWRDLMSEKVGEIKAPDHRARWPGLDGQRLPAPWPLRRHDGRRIRMAQLDRESNIPAATFPPTMTKSFTSTARPPFLYGRGSVLTVDLTNRCNMMCDPCFMDANQVGYVHELG